MSRRTVSEALGMGTGTLGAGLGHPSGALLLNAPRPLGSQAGWGQTGMMQGLGCDHPIAEPRCTHAQDGATVPTIVAVPQFTRCTTATARLPPWPGRWGVIPAAPQGAGSGPAAHIPCSQGTTISVENSQPVHEAACSAMAPRARMIAPDPLQVSVFQPHSPLGSACLRTGSFPRCWAASCIPACG